MINVANSHTHTACICKCIAFNNNNKRTFYSCDGLGIKMRKCLMHQWQKCWRIENSPLPYLFHSQAMKPPAPQSSPEDHGSLNTSERSHQGWGQKRPLGRWNAASVWADSLAEPHLGNSLRCAAPYFSLEAPSTTRLLPRFSHCNFKFTNKSGFH